MLSNYLMKRAAAHGRSRRFTRQIEWRLCEPLLTNPLEAAKRRFVPKAALQLLLSLPASPARDA